MAKRKLFIAIVDDDSSVRRAIRRLVCSVGMEAETFASGQEFIARVKETTSSRHDGVILDVQMPGLTGLQVQEHLARIDCRIPIMFITGQDDLRVRELALAAGAAAFLQKPFNDELFIDALYKAVKAGSRRS